MKPIIILGKGPSALYLPKSDKYDNYIIQTFVVQKIKSAL